MSAGQNHLCSYETGDSAPQGDCKIEDVSGANPHQSPEFRLEPKKQHEIVISGKLPRFTFDYSNSTYNLISVIEFGDLGYKNLSRTFYGATMLEHFAGGETSLVENMNGMFKDTSSLTYVDLSTFNTTNVEEMTGMFMNSSVTSITFPATLDVSIVTKMNFMFFNTTSLNSLDLSAFRNLMPDVN